MIQLGVREANCVPLIEIKDSHILDIELDYQDITVPLWRKNGEKPYSYNLLLKTIIYLLPNDKFHDIKQIIPSIKLGEFGGNCRIMNREGTRLTWNGYNANNCLMKIMELVNKNRTTFKIHMKIHLKNNKRLFIVN